MMRKLVNKAICAAFVILGAMSACAAGVREDLKDDNGNVVGYKVTGLGDDQNETAVVFTKITETGVMIPWTVPTNLENVQFLVVGGGGGGGGGSGDAAGAGGGGGAVITGVVTFKENDKLHVKIGKGGTGGTKLSETPYNDGTAAAVADSEETYFKVNGVDCVRALCGGRDMGRNMMGGEGGSNAGNRGKVTDAQTFTLADRDGDINTSLVKSYTSYAHQGGIGHSGSYRPAAGGGGAMEDGGAVNKTKIDSITEYTAGNGGDGFTSSITGEEKVYGSGGGGGITVYENKAYSYVAGKGGVGAGDGARATEKGAAYGNGGDGLANQGGGGGGGAYGNGGNGGSGIVVFRYVEPPPAVAKIGDTEYASLGAAIEAAGTQDEVVVVADVATDAAFEIIKKVVIDLNGKTIKTTEADTEGCGVFWVKNGGELTLNGEGTINGVGGNIYNIAIWADGGKVTINGGNYTNEGAQDDGPDGAHFDLIYVKNGGAVEINGGTFKCETPKWTLNSHDTKKGTIVVKGGTFYQFNPSDCTTEGAGTNFCADGYAAELNNEGYYVVAKLAIEPNGTIEVIASSPDDAASKVTILVPDAMKDVVTADRYVEYFVKSAEYNASTGKYTVTAALNPDVVKPIIAETTADDTTKEAFVIDADGNVTLNINNKMPGLYYGVQVLAELGADPVAVVPETNGSLFVPAENLPDGNAAFFKVIVDFNEINEFPEAE